MSIPTPHMFKQESYANGGIVAFDEGGKTNMYPPLSEEQKARRDELEAIKYLDEGKAAKDKKEMETWKRGVAQTTDEFNALRAQRQAGEENPDAAKIMSNARKPRPAGINLAVKASSRPNIKTFHLRRNLSVSPKG